MPRIRTEFDPYGPHGTARKWLATNQRPWLRPVCNAIVAYAQQADEIGASLVRVGIALRNPDLMREGYEYQAKATLADYLLGLA